MKKSIILIQLIILTLFIILLSKYFWIEEVLILFLVPIVIVSIVSGFTFLIIKLVGKINLKKFVNKSFIVVSALQLALCVFIIWSVYSRSFNKTQLYSDIDYAKTFMEDVHPNLYAVIDENKFSWIIDSLETTIPLEISEIEAMKFQGAILSNLKDGHTGLSMNNYLKRGSILFRKVLPYRFKIKDDKIYILKNYSKRKNIPIGSEIVSINNKSASQCLNEISGLMSFEINTLRNGLLQLPMIWGMWNNFEDFDIVYKTPENKVENITTSSGLISNLSMIWDFTGFGFSIYNYKILDRNVAYINIKAFNNLEKFKDFLKNTFSDIKQNEITSVIIDVRENSGGNTSLAKELMQYISPVEFVVFDSSLLKISNHLIHEYSLDTAEYKPGSFHLETNDKIELIENPLRFNGSCSVLTSGYTYSTALDFAAMVRCFNIGKIVGSETGGRTISYGSPLSISLPETGIEIKISRKRFVNACGIESDSGLIPDYIVENSIEDDINNFDRVLEYAKTLK